MSTQHAARACGIVSGSSSGIGAACAAMLAAQGYNVAINYTRNEPGARAVADQCAAYGVDTLVVQGDVSQEADCSRIVEAAVTRWGQLDALVNNAGITRLAADDEFDIQRQDFDDILSVNVIGAWLLTRAARPHLEMSDNASVVNISSDSGFSGSGSSIPYSVSKGALNTLTLSLARVMAPRVRVNAVCPGYVDTDWLLQKMDREAMAVFKRRVADAAPLKRLVSAEDVAEAVGSLIVGGRSITGQLIMIDSGMHLNVGDAL